MARNGEQAYGEHQRQRIILATFIVGIIAVVIILVVGAKALSGHSSSKDATDSTLASAALTKNISTVPSSTFSSIGVGGITSFPQILKSPALTQDGKPEVLYIGAEFCPYCAAERWPMAVALSRFGSFSNLGVSHSASADAYPNTATLSFHGATYSSQYLSFTGVEIETNKPSGTGYQKLDTPTAAQQKIIDTYDVPPYVPAGSAGSIPFIDLGGQYVITGSNFSPQLLAGKTADEISATLATPSDPVAQKIIGSANAVTAALCKLTNDQPSTICADPVIKNLQPKLGTTQQ